MLRIAALLFVAVLLVGVAVEPVYAIASGQIKDVALTMSGVLEEPFTKVEGVRTDFTATAVSPGMQLEWTLLSDPSPGQRRVMQRDITFTNYGAFVLPPDTPAGNYRLAVRPWQSGSPGTVRLCFQTWPGATTDGTISSGQTKTFDLQAGHWRSLSYSGGAGHLLVMFNWSDQIYLTDEKGATVLPVLENPLSRWRSWQIPASGQCIIMGRSFQPPDLLNFTVMEFPNGEGRGIASGQTVSGSLSPYAVDAYAFQGTTGDKVFFRTQPLTGFSLSNMGLLTPSGLVQTFNTDSPDQVLLSETGTYYLIATSGLLSTNYAVTYIHEDGPYTSAADPDGGTIVSGQTRSGTYVTGDMDAYRISLAAGHVLAWHAELAYGWAILVEPDGTMTWQDNSDLVFTATQTGPHLILCWGGNGQNYGVTTIVRGATQTMPTDLDGGVIGSNDIKSCSLAVGDLDAFTFSGQAGDFVFFRVLTPGAGTRKVGMQLMAPDGTKLTNPMAVAVQHAYKLPQTGTYWAICTYGSSPVALPYRFSYLKVPGTFTTTADPDGGTISMGDIRTGNLQLADYDAYLFAGHAGDNVRALLTSPWPAFQKRFDLYSASGALLGTDAANISYTLTQSGNYYFVVYEQSGAVAGPYSLSFETGAPRVVSTVPANNSTKAEPKNVQFVFDRNMNYATFASHVQLQKLVLTPGGATFTDVPFTTQWTATTRTLTVTPASPLAFSTPYLARVQAGVASTVGTAMAMDHTLNFIVTPSAIAYTSPAHGTGWVPVTTKVNVGFRWPVKQFSAMAKVKLLQGATEIPCTWRWVSPTMVAELTPAAALAPGTVYYIDLASALALMDGTSCNWTERYQFSTRPATEPPATVTTAVAETSAGVSLTVTLSAAATVTVSVENIAGRTVAVLPARSLPAGASTLLWNGVGRAGARVPAGHYVARVTACAADGQQRQTCVSVPLTR